MRIRTWYPLALVLLLAGTAGPLQAQEARAPLVLTLPASTRALAMADAFALGSTDSDALFYNPAHADRLRGASAAVQWYGASSALYTMSAAMEWWNGALAVGVRALDYGADSGAPGSMPDEAGLPGTGAVGAERAASLAYARRIRGLRVGVTGHLLQHRMDGEVSTLPAADVALATTLGPVRAGLAARNLGPSYELRGGDVELPALVNATAAAASSRPVGPLDLLPALSLTYEIDGDVVPGAGVEVSYWPVPGRTFSLRFGLRDAAAGIEPYTAGAGFTGDRLILDYAMVPFTDGTLSHRVGVRWR